MIGTEVVPEAGGEDGGVVWLEFEHQGESLQDTDSCTKHD